MTSDCHAARTYDTIKLTVSVNDPSFFSRYDVKINAETLSRSSQEDYRHIDNGKDSDEKNECPKQPHH